MRFHLLPKIVLFHPSNDHFRAMQCNVPRWGAVMMKYLAAGKAEWIMSTIHINVMEGRLSITSLLWGGVKRKEISTLSVGYVTHANARLLRYSTVFCPSRYRNGVMDRHTERMGLFFITSLISLLLIKNKRGLVGRLNRCWSSPAHSFFASGLVEIYD
jgi:hypothetical protein